MTAFCFRASLDPARTQADVEAAATPGCARGRRSSPAAAATSPTSTREIAGRHVPPGGRRATLTCRRNRMLHDVIVTARARADRSKPATPSRGRGPSTPTAHTVEAMIAPRRRCARQDSAARSGNPRPRRPRPRRLARRHPCSTPTARTASATCSARSTPCGSRATRSSAPSGSRPARRSRPSSRTFAPASSRISRRLRGGEWREGTDAQGQRTRTARKWTHPRGVVRPGRRPIRNARTRNHCRPPNVPAAPASTAPSASCAQRAGVDQHVTDDLIDREASDRGRARRGARSARAREEGRRS